MNVFEKYGLPDPSKPAESQSVFAKYGLPEPEAEPQGGFIPAAKQAIGAGIKGLGQAAADFIPGVSQGNGLSSYGQSVIDANPTTIHSISDIADSPWQTVKEATGNALGSMGPMLGARAAGMGITAAAPFTGPAAPFVAGVGQLIANAGPIVAAAAPSFGGIREQQIASDPNNEADAKSKAIALLGAGTVGLIESKFGPQEWALAAMKKGGIEALASKFAGKSIPAAVGKGIAHGAAVEGAEELVQNPIEQLAGYQDPTTKSNVLDTLHGGAMGAIGGGVLGGGMAGTARAVSGPIGKAADTADKSGATFKAEFDRVMQEEQAIAAEQTKTTKQGPKNEQAQEASTQGATEVPQGPIVSDSESGGGIGAPSANAATEQPAELVRNATGADTEAFGQPSSNGLGQDQIAQPVSAAPVVDNEFAQFAMDEAKSLDAQRHEIAGQQAITRSAKLEAVNGRVEAQRQQQAEANRLAVMDSIDLPAMSNPVAAFEAGLARAGIRQSKATQGEVEQIGRRVSAVAGLSQPEPDIPSLPNELELPEKQKSAVAPSGRRMQVLIRRVQSGARIKGGKLLNKNGMVTANLTADEEAALQPYVKQKEPAKTVAQPYTPEQATKQFGTPAQPTTGGILPQQSTALDVPSSLQAPSKQPASTLQGRSQVKTSQDQSKAVSKEGSDAIDLSSRSDKQLAYISTNGRPGYKEAATAEIAKRAETSQPAKVVSSFPTSPAAEMGNGQSKKDAISIAREIMRNKFEASIDDLSAVSKAARDSGISHEEMFFGDNPREQKHPADIVADENLKAAPTTTLTRRMKTLIGKIDSSINNEVAKSQRQESFGGRGAAGRVRDRARSSEGRNLIRSQADRIQKELDRRASQSTAEQSSAVAPVVNDSLTTAPAAETWRITPQQEVAEVRAPPEVAQPTQMKSVSFDAITMDGPKKVRGHLFELPGYKGPQLAVVEYKIRGKAGYRVYLPKSGVMVEDSNGQNSLNDTLKIAVKRISNLKNRTAEQSAATTANESQSPEPKVAATVKDNLTVQDETPARPSGTSTVKSRQSVIQGRDDLVGAIMRATGGNGIAASMAQTIAGDTSNNLPKLKGLFTNRGQEDLGDVAMLLRKQEGYDVRDGDHLSELIRNAAAGDVAVSMERQARDSDAAKEQQHRDRIRDIAKRRGIKTAFVKFADLEKLVFAMMESRRQKAVDALDERSRKRFEAALEESYRVMPEDDVEDVLVSFSKHGLTGRDYWNQVTDRLRIMNSEAIYAKEQEELYGITEGQEPAWIKDGDGRGDSETGSGNQTEQGAAKGFSLEQQTLSDIDRQEAERVAAEKAKQDAVEQEAKDKKAAEKQSLESKVKARAANPDNFQFGEDSKAAAKPMGGLFDQPAKDEQKPVQPAKAESPAQDYAEGDEIRFTANNPGVGQRSVIEGILVQKADTNGGNFRLRIRTSEANAQGGGNVTPQVYSQNGTVEKIGNGLNAPRDRLNMTPDQAAQHRIDMLAKDFTSTIYEESQTDDFDPAEVPDGARGWAKDAGIDDRTFIDAVIAAVEKETFRRKAGTLAALRGSLQEQVASLSGKPSTGRYIEPSNRDNGATSQRIMADRAGRTATLSVLNDAVRKVNPEAAYSDDQILNVATDKIDAVRDWLVEQGRKAQPAKPEPTEKPAISGYANQPESLKWAENDVGGRVVYSHGDIALLEGFSPFGNPVYSGIKGDSRTRVDIDSYTGQMFNETEKAELLKARASHITEQRKIHEARPDGPFIGGKQLAKTDGVSAEIAGVAQKWLTMLGIKSRVFIATKADVSSVEAIDKYGLRGPFAAIRSSGTKKDEDGGKRTLPNGDHYIILPPATRKSASLETLAHEIGHILETDEWGKADPAIKAAVMADYQKWLSTAGNTSAKDWVSQLRAHTTGKQTAVRTNSTADKLPAYWTSFGEYFADQVSRWATTTDKPLTAVDSFFKRIAVAMRRLYSSLAGKPYLPTTAMKSYLDGRDSSTPLSAPEPAAKPEADDARFNVAANLKISPADSAVYEMARDGKSAAEILEFLGKASRNGFNRYLANALRNMGVSSTVKLDSMGGWAFNRSKQGSKYAAAYSPKTDTIALFTPREAERHALHEFTHAATLKAIEAGGRPALEMKRLFQHVQATGKLDGMYGMSLNEDGTPNLDEFVAEAFSNPEFQRALMKVAAPRAYTVKTAWDAFVRFVAKLVGLKSPALQSALDKAMVLGAELMRENAKLSGKGGDTRFAIAHHGTPHLFAPEPGFPHGRFRLDKMGTGEGAQAYGWGVYFAENSDVAKGYADRLGMALGTYSAKVGEVSASEYVSEFAKKNNADADVIMAYLSKYIGRRDDGLSHKQALYQVVRVAKRNAKSPIPILSKGAIAAQDFLNSVNITIPEKNLYRLDIPDDVMPKLLDWDKPLSEQPAAVRKALKSMVADVASSPNANRASRDILRAFNPYGRADLLSEISERYGWNVRGDKLVKKNGDVVPESAIASQLKMRQRGKVYDTAGDLYRDLAQVQGSDAEVSLVLAANGIPGLRYLDGQSRTDGEGTHNYVIWDQPTLDRIALLERNGEKLDDIRFSQESDTINVDGTDRPRTNSNGKPIAGTDEALRFNVESSDQWISSSADNNTLDDIIYKIANKQIDLRRTVQDITKKIGEIADEYNPELAETLYHGKAANETKNFLDFELRPLIRRMLALGVDTETLETYLWARHAEERNEQIAKINPRLPDGGSGLTNEQARQLLSGQDVTIDGKTIKGVPQDKLIEIGELASMSDAILKKSRELLVSSGLESQSEVDSWSAMYQHYAPLHREEFADDRITGKGLGMSVKGPSGKRAIGSDKPVSNILASIVSQRELYITRAEKNKVGNATYGLATIAPNEDFWKAIDPMANASRDAQQLWAKIRKQSEILASKPDGDEAMEAIIDAMKAQHKALMKKAIPGMKKVKESLEALGLPAEMADRILAEPKELTINKRTGMVVERVNPLLRHLDNVLATRINGRDVFVVFNARDKRASRMAMAMKNLDADNLGFLLGNMAKATRYFSAINTQFNPIFGVTNLARDIQTAMLNLSSTPLAGHKAEIAKRTFSALHGIYRDLRDHRAGKAPSSKWAATFEQFKANGGATGYRDMYDSLNDRAKDLQDELKKMSMSKGRRLATLGQSNPVFAWLSDYNEMMENAARVAAFSVAIEQDPTTGKPRMSPAQAAALAKELTVNFNRKGQVAAQAGAMYAFFNAAVQGTSRIAQTLVTLENGKPKLTHVGKKIIAGGVMVGVVQAILGALAGWDDEEPPQFVRERSLIIPIGDHYVSIPMPLGYNVLPNIGRITTEFALSGFKDPAKRISSMINVLFDTFNPIGNAGMSLQTITPTVIDPLAALSENKDWTGKPIKRLTFNEEAAGYKNAKDTATAWSKLIAEGLNYLTGGTEHKAGLMSPTPDQIDYLIGQITGGVGREVSKVVQTGSSIISGEDLPLYKIPLAGKFVGSTTGQAAESSRFYANLDELKAHKAEIDGRRKAHQDVAGYLQDNPDARLVPMATRIEHSVQELRRAKRVLLAKSAPPEQVKAIDARITAYMKVLNVRVDALQRESR